MQRKLMLAAAVALVCGTGMTGADPWSSQTPPERLAAGAPAGFEAALAVPTDTDTGLPTPALLDAVEAWLVAGFDLPKAGERPRVAFLPPPTMFAMRLAEAPPNRPRQYAQPEDEADTVAIYNSMTRTIYLPEGWTGGTPAELSILVHEMVHHLQNIGGLRYPCAEAQESPAYEAQAAWLALFGTDLEAAFGVDAFALFVRTRCFF